MRFRISNHRMDKDTCCLFPHFPIQFARFRTFIDSPIDVHVYACIYSIQMISCLISAIAIDHTHSHIDEIEREYIRFSPATRIQWSVQMAIVHMNVANIIDIVMPNSTRRWNRYSSYSILRSSLSKPPNVEVDIFVSMLVALLLWRLRFSFLLLFTMRNETLSREWFAFFSFPILLLFTVSYNVLLTVFLHDERLIIYLKSPHYTLYNEMNTFQHSLIV